jgi:hypothetical protein
MLATGTAAGNLMNQSLLTRLQATQQQGALGNQIFNQNMGTGQALDALGQEYQNYFTGTLSGSLQGSDVELVVGLDLTNRDSFVMPVRSELEVFEDDSMHRQRRAGVYGWEEHGFAVLDNRRVLLGSL